MSSAIGIPESYGFSPEVIKCVQDMIDACISDGKYLAGWEAIQEVLIAKGLASTIQMPPDYVGVHPDNRSKFGLTGPDSHAHGEEILDIGFSWKKAADATAQELPPPGQPRHDDAENHADVFLGRRLKPPSAGANQETAECSAMRARISSSG